MNESPDPRTPWPSLYEYAMAHPCPTCKAPAGTDCRAPRLAKQPEPIHRQHATRQDAASEHYNRDVAAAPWSEDREPGRRYDSLPRPVPAPPKGDRAPCRCERQGDWWLCRARPRLEETPQGEYCELGYQLYETRGNDWWPPSEQPDRYVPPGVGEAPWISALAAPDRIQN